MGLLEKFKVCFSIVLAIIGILGAQETSGWQNLFSGTDNSLKENWVDYLKDGEKITSLTPAWQVVDSVMVLTYQTNEIRSIKKYGNFVFKMKYKVIGNQGFMYRSTLCGVNSWESGVEFSLHPDPLNNLHVSGAAYDLFEAPIRNTKPFSGEDTWNEMIIVAINDSIETFHNGLAFPAYKYWSQNFQSSYSNPSTKWNSNSFPCFCRPYENGMIQNTGYVNEGFFVFQANHGGEVWVKSIEVLPDPIIGCMDSKRQGFNSDATFDYNWDVEGKGDVYSRCGGAVAVKKELKSINQIKIYSEESDLIISKDKFEILSFNLFSIQGEKVHRGVIKKSQIRYQKLKPGIYLLNVNTPQGFIIRKFVHN